MTINKHLVRRQFWIKKIEDAWHRRSIVWLSGVRRVGKTSLCQSFEDVEYIDCERPQERKRLEDPEAFLKDFKKRRVVLDEIHRLDNPSEFLKIAADHYADVKIIATGSSTLSSMSRFRDTLTGRKTELRLTPMIDADLNDFGLTNLTHRLRYGGLPPFFLSSQPSDKDVQEWMDSYWAKDIQEMFRLERRYPFLKFSELLFSNSSGIFEATAYAAPCEVSRGTIVNYLAALETTSVVHVIRPFSEKKSNEIVSAPKVYGFDTGFVCAFKGWNELRKDDLGFLWEHYVLNELMGYLQTKGIRYWRDKRGHEVDFVLTPRGKPPIAIECKWSTRNADFDNLQAFRRRYPEGKNYLVAQDVEKTYSKTDDAISITIINLKSLTHELDQLNFGL